MMEAVQTGGKPEGPSRAGVGAATGLMAAWLIGLLFIWAPGLLDVPALGPWCDYSRPRTESHIDPEFREGTVWTVHDQIETSWTPPGIRCADASRPLDEHGHIGGHYPLVGGTPWAILLQLMLIAIPMLVWWAPPRSQSDIPVRRRASGMLIAGGGGLLVWSAVGVINGSVSLAVVYTAIGVALTAVAFAYRRTHRVSDLVNARSTSDPATSG